MREHRLGVMSCLRFETFFKSREYDYNIGPLSEVDFVTPVELQRRLPCGFGVLEKFKRFWNAF
jgi:hypothetical protein